MGMRDHLCSSVDSNSMATRLARREHSNRELMLMVGRAEKLSGLPIGTELQSIAIVTTDSGIST